MDDPLYTPLSVTSPPDSPGNHRHGELVGDVAVPPFHERVTGDNREPSPSRRLDHDELNPAVDVSNSPLPAELDHFPSVDEQASRPRRSIRPPKQGEPSRKPQKIEESLTSCHQCRKKSARDKLKCTFNRPSGQVCGKFFCGRCMLNRYPEMEFDLSFKQWTCPYCLDVCNCSICTQRRGEEYISARGGGFAGAPTKSHAVVIIPDKPTPSGIPTAPPDSPHPMFWATVYGLSGERVGQAFLSDNSQFSTAQIPTAKLKVESNRPGKRRVYIGEPQPSWGIKSGKPIKYLDNAPDDLSNEQLAILLRGKSAEGHGNRIYIGDRAALPEPSKRLSDADVHHSSPLPSRSSSPALSDSDGTLTPLSVLEAKMCPQPGLSEAQVVQAIHDAMAVATV
ncbi:hypothetical protein BJ138DRAFT_1017501 [Hygrophoropsis aurantiaca]|uniref:Uncharacterized protein n=1 Tax=Hygrophoropsis aurantiaca TaxID=72124 RepID=A0ACB7ZY48_9AGAM|nr:hypothetical protein BJ138DRAFT_1017501 [Hygrophoropsis aurantiaca]